LIQFFSIDASKLLKGWPYFNILARLILSTGIYYDWSAKNRFLLHSAVAMRNRFWSWNSVGSIDIYGMAIKKSRANFWRLLYLSDTYLPSNKIDRWNNVNFYILMVIVASFWKWDVCCWDATNIIFLTFRTTFKQQQSSEWCLITRLIYTF
jgi:hypothetical protein